jgi:pilus assembly protein Flp/PilA
MELNMQNLCRWLRDFAANEDGPTATEYAIMIGLILMVVFFSVTSFGTQTNNSFTRSGNAIKTAGS